MPLQPLTLPNTFTCHKILWFCWLSQLGFPKTKKPGCTVATVYTQYESWFNFCCSTLYQYPGSSQVMLLQFITINCFILEQTILMRQSGFKLIQKRHNWKVSSLFVLFLLTRFYDMTRLQIALFMINWQLCKLYMLKTICCTSCSGKNSEMKSSLPGACEASIAWVLSWVSHFRYPMAMGAGVRKDHLIQKPNCL